MTPARPAFPGKTPVTGFHRRSEPQAYTAAVPSGICTRLSCSAEVPYASSATEKIAFINGSLFSLVSDQRQEAFENSMHDSGLEVYPELMGHGYYIPETAQYYVSNFIAAGATIRARRRLS